MALILHGERVEEGMLFGVRDGAEHVEPHAWALADGVRLPSGATTRVGVLLRLLEDGKAELRERTRVFLSDETVAGLDEAERRWLGLPRACDLALELRATGSFADPDFAIERRLLYADGRPVVAPSRDGCFLHVGEDHFVLADPLFSLFEAIDRFNEARTRGIEDRMLAWAPIAAQLPEGVRLGDELQSLRIVLATAFSLSPFRNRSGEPDVDPIVGRWVEARGGAPDSAPVFEEALPAARQREFADRFRSLQGVKRRYLAGEGFYVVLSESVERALRVVHEVQRADAGTRRRFLTRPAAFLRDALQPDSDEQAAAPEDSPVDRVLFDEGLSERVKGIGIWQPKVLPWLEPSGESWLPEDAAGLSIDGDLVSIPPTEAPELLVRVRAARAEGRDSVEHGGMTIPATEDTEKALEQLIATAQLAKRGGRSPEEKTTPGEQDGSTRLTLLIIDNLEQLGFRFTPRPSRSSTHHTPRTLRTRLLEHQERGLHWLQEHWASGSPGALLADDMGLGKTLQALAFLAWLAEEMEAGSWPRRPFLIVAPTGLLRNWRDEHDLHLDCGGVGRLVEAYGAGLRGLRSARDTEDRELATGLPSLDAAELARSDWVMTTYETLRDYQHSFARVHWAATVFDEAQKIKNPAAGLTDAAKAMKQDFTLTMTGTPVENRVEDLWCIADASRPGGLGSLKDFSARFRAGTDEAGQSSLEALRDELIAGSAPAVMLRRLKEDHLDGLPAKEIHVHRQAMPDLQARAYRAAVDSARSGAPMLQVLQRLRAVSLHPGGSMLDGDEAFISESARLALAFGVLDEIRERREKALVFLESRAVQDALIEILQRRYRLSQRVLVINGEVTGASRKARVDEFQSRPGFDVMVLSPRAGGVGLTLTAANHVIHLTRWWNPAVEDQCTDRVHRIGQERVVHVHHVLAVHPEYAERSFDVRLAALLDRKRLLNRSVLAPTAATSEDFEALYREAVVE